MTNLLYIANDNLLELIGLTEAVSGEFVNDAIVRVTLKDAAGAVVPGETWPLTMSYAAGSDGVYRAILDDALPLNQRDKYTAEISVDAGGGLVAFWRFPLFAAHRTI